MFRKTELFDVDKERNIETFGEIGTSSDDDDDLVLVDTAEATVVKRVNVLWCKTWRRLSQ